MLLPYLLLATALAVLVPMLWALYLLVLKPLRIRRLCARAAERELDLKVTQTLGMGREGVVLAATQPQSSQEIALKILYAHTGSKGDRVLERSREIAAKLNKAAEATEPAWPTLLDSGKLTVESFGSVPYQVLEKIKGDSILKGALATASAEQKLTRLIELVAQLGFLAARGIYFIHVDPDNLMTDPAGRIVMIDLDGFKPDPINEEEWYRMCRRLARTILAVLRPTRYEILVDGNVRLRQFLERLEQLRKSTKRQKIDRDLRFDSLEEFRGHLELAVETIKKKSP
jgi:serine/threonine protein kinase